MHGQDKKTGLAVLRRCQSFIFYPEFLLLFMTLSALSSAIVSSQKWKGHTLVQGQDVAGKKYRPYSGLSSLRFSSALSTWSA
jgi:hypothetical protein